MHIIMAKLKKLSKIHQSHDFLLSTFHKEKPHAHFWVGIMMMS